MHNLMKRTGAVIFTICVIMASSFSASAVYQKTTVKTQEQIFYVIPESASKDYLAYMLECSTTNTTKSLELGLEAETLRNQKIQTSNLSTKKTNFFSEYTDGKIISEKIREYIIEQNKKWYEKYTILQTNYVTMSHYCRCYTCNGRSDGATASGVYLSQNGFDTIAVDTRYYPLGSQFLVYVPYRDEPLLVTATDVGGAINGQKIDMYIGNKGHSVCFQYGMAYGVKMQMIRRGW